MQIFEKQIVVISLTVFLGLVIVFSGFTELVHDFTISAIEPLLTKVSGDKAAMVLESLSYTIQFGLAILILLTPFSLTGGMWFLKIAFELVLGKNANSNVFVFSLFLNKVVAVLCLSLFVYSIYQQYKWTIKLTQPLPFKKNDKDLARLI
jgi:hypothetical protein